MASNPQITANCTGQEARVSTFIGAPLTFVHRVGSGFLSRLNDYIYAVQISKAKSALSQLGDSQLAQIGIERHDIPKHAERLVGPKAYDRALLRK